MKSARSATLLNLLKALPAPSVDDVVANWIGAAPDRTTAYRHLEELVQARLASRVEVNGTWRYELGIQPHVHFVCRHCHAIQDGPLVHVSNCEDLLAQTRAALNRSKAAGLSMEFRVEVLCKQCQVGREPLDKGLQAHLGLVDEPLWPDLSEEQRRLRDRWIGIGAPETIGFEGTPDEPDWPQTMDERWWVAHPECNHCYHDEPTPRIPKLTLEGLPGGFD